MSNVEKENDFEVSCLCCGEPAGTFNSPNDATVWTSHGNYGSTLYDPDPGGVYDGRFFLEVSICDTCLKKHADRVVSVSRTASRPTYATKQGVLNPEDDWS